MPAQKPPSAPVHERPQGDPWHAFGYLVSGVGVYGLLGWLADRWLHTEFWVVVGILAGAGLGLYLTTKRFSLAWSRSEPAPPGLPEHSTEPSPRPPAAPVHPDLAASQHPPETEQER